MDKCPDEYRENCSNYPAKCPVCAAGWGSSKLFYAAIDSSLDPHPHAETLRQYKLRGAKAKASGHKQEKLALAKLASKLVKQTVGSGSVQGDGDALVAGIGRIETKSGKNRKIGITKDEYEKGVKQGIKAWQVVTPSGVFYILTEETFLGIINVELE